MDTLSPSSSRESGRVILDGQSLDIEQLISVAYTFHTLAISEPTWENVRASQQYIHQQVETGKIVYGVTTGFGSNADQLISRADAQQLQENLIISHACGVGEPLPPKVVRAIMCIRLNTLLAGFSGVQEHTLKLLQALINQEVYPIIPEQGSVGASGDLCPLSHMALPLLGVGEVELQEKKAEELGLKGKWSREIDGFRLVKLPARQVLNALDLKPVHLSFKEGLALNNGTTLMTALGVIGVYEAERLLKLGALTSSLVFEALCARSDAFFAGLHTLRRHTAQQSIAASIRKFTHQSTYINLSAQSIISHFFQSYPECKQWIKAQELVQAKDVEVNSALANFPDEIPPVLPNKIYEAILKWLPIGSPWKSIIHFAAKKQIPQDAYSVRCTPQVLGASLHAIQHVRQTVEGELNAVVDNPIIFTQEDRIVSGGNFHGQPVALVLDYLKLAIAEMGSLWERQINKLLDPCTNDGLPAFLIENKGLHSGLMIPQYTAAALVSENKVLVHPATADSIPTSANQEDHVSMGPIAGRQALEIMGNVKKILAIEMMTAAQALDLRRAQLEPIFSSLQMGEKTEELYKLIRSIVPHHHVDRLLYTDIQNILERWDGFLRLV